MVTGLLKVPLSAVYPSINGATLRDRKLGSIPHNFSAESVQEDCGLKLCGRDSKYTLCKTLPSADGSTDFEVFWNLEPNENGTTSLHVALDAPSKGWAGWGFPGARGGMINGSAVIVKSDSSESGHSLLKYYMTRLRMSTVNSNFPHTACKTPTRGFFSGQGPRLCRRKNDNKSLLHA